jgi:PBCV-specific basic adaptor domain
MSSQLLYEIKYKVKNEDNILTFQYNNDEIITKENYDDELKYATDMILAKLNTGRSGVGYSGTTFNRAIDINDVEIISGPILVEQSGGKHKSKNHKRRTPEKVEVNKKVRAVYVGPKGGKYVRKNGKYVPLKKLV